MFDEYLIRCGKPLLSRSLCFLGASQVCQGDRLRKSRFGRERIQSRRLFSCGKRLCVVALGVQSYCFRTPKQHHVSRQCFLRC